MLKVNGSSLEPLPDVIWAENFKYIAGLTFAVP